jgi:uncharacterized protein YyaL (SSP411 family)
LNSNRLIHEKSPYLLQHAHNPVDWYAWGSEAFEAAKREDKPILVSIGYSTCHWCHVMEKESYEDAAGAALMNQVLINIKVDREERPDVDKIYMTAVSAMTGQGGWPLNIFLTPDLKPIFGGTYFPPVAKWGQPAWKDVVSQVGQAWHDPESRKKMLEAASNITEALKKYTTVSHDPIQAESVWLDRAFQAFQAAYDSEYGGFGPAPKFPMPVYHNFLQRYYARTKNAAARDMTLHTLRSMAAGGLYDHLGGGFARYSTDERWHIPHFEKMLYDNAQLAVNYLEAWQITKADDLKQVAEETLRYIQREMTHPEGGFYSAEDADSLELPLPSRERVGQRVPSPGLRSPSPEVGEGVKKEGAFYVWEKKEILDVLGQKDGESFCAAYGVEEKGNARLDPHGEFAGKNILSIADPAKAVALSSSRKKLFEARLKRPRPQLDDKIIAGWNGLMISAFARAYQILADKAYLESARRAAEFLRGNLYDPKTQTLYRRWREGERRVPGIADDYAFVIQALLDLYEADFDRQWLDWALKLTEAQNKRFYDTDKGGFFMTAADHDDHLLLRIKEDMDNVEPSASSVSALNLLRLAQYTGQNEFQEMAEKTLRGFGANLKESPRAMPQMLVALDFALTEPHQIVIAGTPDASDTKRMIQILNQHFIPVKIQILADGGDGQASLAQALPFLAEMKPLGGKSTAYVCTQHTCKEPTNEPQIFESLLKSLAPEL